LPRLAPAAGFLAVAPIPRPASPGRKGGRITNPAHGIPVVAGGRKVAALAPSGGVGPRDHVRATARRPEQSTRRIATPAGKCCPLLRHLSVPDILAAKPLSVPPLSRAVVPCLAGGGGGSRAGGGVGSGAGPVPTSPLCGCGLVLVSGDAGAGDW